MPTPEELAAVNIILGNLSVTDYYSIGQYETDVLQKIEEIFLEKDTIVLVGGR